MKANYLSVLVLFLVGSCATHHHGAEGGAFPDTVDEIADLDGALMAAKADGQLALVVIGANWCHDSSALIEALDAPENAAAVAAFERVLINTGQFESGFLVAERLGLPIYTHTPTMLIVDPATGEVVNWDDHYQFRDAASMSAEEVGSYLAAHQEASVRLAMPEAGSEVTEWATSTAARIKGGYAKLSGYEGFEGDAFFEDWKALRPVRYGFGEDYPAVLLKVAETGEAGELPVYGVMPWEEGTAE